MTFFWAERIVDGAGQTSVAKQRIVNTRFWDDSYIVSLSQTEKLLFLYLLTNPLTNISGVYELPLSRVVFDTKISERDVKGILAKLERDNKIIVSTGWIGIVNFIKYQTLNPKVKQGILAELGKAPRNIIDRLSIDYRMLSIDSGSLWNSNSNLNINSNEDRSERRSSGLPRDIQTKRGELVSKWSLRKS